MTQMPPARLALIILAVEDRVASVELYRQAFDWTITVDTPTYSELALPDGLRLGIYDRHGFGRNFGQTPEPVRGVSCTELYIYVDDLDIAIARAKRAGARALGTPGTRDWGDVVAYFSDLDGNIIALAHPQS